MATKTKPDSAQVTKQRRGTSQMTDTIQGKRTTGTISRSSNGGAKSSVATASVEKNNVPSYLRPTQSSRTESPKTKPSPTLNRRQSIDRPPQTTQLQRVLFSAGPRSPAVKTPSALSSPRITSSRPPELLKSLSSSARSRPTNSRPAPEFLKSKTMPKPVASSRPGSASGSMSRLGSTGKTLKKSSVPALSPKRQNVSDFNNEDHIIAAQAESEAAPQVIVEEEKARPSPPPPVEKEPVENDVIVVEEDHINDEQQQEEEEVVVVSTINEEEHEEVHRETAIIHDSPTADIVELSEEKAVEDEDEDEEVNHDIEFLQEEESHGGCIDEGEGYSEGDGEGSESSKPPPPLEGNHEGEELISNYAADAEENPNMSLKETVPVEDATEVVEVVTPMNHSPPKQSREEEAESVVPAKIALISRPALNAHKSTLGKKESPMYNDMIEETASKLLEKRKNKVRALVGAFETVISLQE